MRNGIRQAFKSQNIKKLIKTFDLLCYTNSFLGKNLLYQLNGIMAIEIYGFIWCIDRCYPVAEGNLVD